MGDDVTISRTFVGGHYKKQGLFSHVGNLYTTSYKVVLSINFRNNEA